MVVYKEKTYPTQNLGLHVSKTAYEKSLQRIPYNKKRYFINN